MSDNTEAPLGAIERLAARVLGGEVVFLIGAGFSLDSEGNTASRLVGRLLVRLLGLARALARQPRARQPALEVLAGLGKVFGLAPGPVTAAGRIRVQACVTPTNVKKLARDYYNFNEWAVRALGMLAHEILALEPEPRRRVAIEAETLTEDLRSKLGSDAVRLRAIDWQHIETLLVDDRDRGKALFLDAMGFMDAAIMAGDPRAADLAAVEASYGDRLRPRHHAIARLAREGLLPALVTTNYDLLLDGAYRLAGFAERHHDSCDTLPATGLARFARVAGAAQFFGRGDGYKAAVIYKIHGCVESYRRAYEEQVQAGAVDTTGNHWGHYLRSMVFTYREIQTWRADAWSRDLLRTLLRTHTLALCGYSGADPVLHATFREVYDEMQESKAMPKSRSPWCDADAPVFFFDVEGQREFHGFEILSAATRASGLPTSRLTEHPNHVQFAIRGGYPSLDDLFTRLHHHVMRALQLKALETRLRHLVPRLLGHPCPDADAKAIAAQFRQQCSDDAVGLQAGNPLDRKRSQDLAMGWTWHFLPAMLREFAIADHVESHRGPGTAVTTARRTASWYFPASERLDWTAWIAVLELCLRRMVAAAQSAGGPGARPPVAQAGPHATVAFTSSSRLHQPRALCIRFLGFDRGSAAIRPRGAFAGVRTWDLDEPDVPWRVQAAADSAGDYRSRAFPSAREVWQWALGTRPDPAAASHYLGLQS